MTGYTPQPDLVPSPWIEEISDEAAAVLAQTLAELATACQDRYERQLLRYREMLRSRLVDPDHPWLPSVAPVQDLSHDHTDALAADFSARQLDLFRPQPEWDTDF